MNTEEVQAWLKSLPREMLLEALGDNPFFGLDAPAQPPCADAVPVIWYMRRLWTATHRVPFDASFWYARLIEEGIDPDATSTQVWQRVVTVWPQWGLAVVAADDVECREELARLRGIPATGETYTHAVPSPDGADDDAWAQIVREAQRRYDEEVRDDHP